MRKLLVLVLLLFINISSYAQCAMCRATMETSAQDDGGALALGLNTGILYLFIIPYLLIGTVAYVWYKKRKKQRYH